MGDELINSSIIQRLWHFSGDTRNTWVKAACITKLAYSIQAGQIPFLVFVGDYSINFWKVALLPIKRRKLQDLKHPLKWILLGVHWFFKHNKHSKRHVKIMTNHCLCKPCQQNQHSSSPKLMLTISSLAMRLIMIKLSCGTHCSGSLKLLWEVSKRIGCPPVFQDVGG